MSGRGWSEHMEAVMAGRPVDVGIDYTCCGGRSIARFDLLLYPQTEDQQRVTFRGNESFVVESAAEHDGLHFAAAGARALQVPEPERSDTTKIHVECPRCRMDPQLTERYVDRQVRAVRDAFLAGTLSSPRVRVPVSTIGVARVRKDGTAR